MLPSEYLLNYKLSSLQSSDHANPSSVDQINRQLNFSHGLSLSLSSDMNEYANSSLCSLLNSIPHQDNDLKDAQYVSFDLVGKNCDSLKFGGPVCNFQNTSQGGGPPDVINGMICNSKYLKAARDLLDELVSVHGIAKKPEKARDSGSSNGGARELSASERHDLQSKLTKLLSLLDELPERLRENYSGEGDWIDKEPGKMSLVYTLITNWFWDETTLLGSPSYENEPKSSPEHAQDTPQSFNERGVDFQGNSSISHPLIDGNQMVQPYGTRADGVFQGDQNVDFGLTQLETNMNFVSGSGGSNFCDDKSDGIMGTHQVTLALGLRQSEKDSKTSLGNGTGNEYYYVDHSGNSQTRFANANLLSDFVA
ncbi:BEL1-like homeodomain 6 [Striga asiatica]|uniref:BEL1-like homeodomain 6 n=1 Tax=Striga asiatica TaxID=4170 RepID=A0A5A7PRE4_STRAF|nr:BEL1-like homeodomain 6 [Striga asiatica]